MHVLPQSNLFQAVQKNNHWQIRVEAGVTVDDIVHPHFWRHVAKKFTDFDVIDVVAKDNSYLAELRVLRHTDLACKVVLTNFIDLTQIDYSDLAATINNEYFVKFQGAEEWCVMRKTDKGTDMVLKGFASEKEAERQKALHIKAIAA